jgi:hypothetical protein
MASSNVCVILDTWKTKCVFTSHEQNIEQNYNLQIAHKSIENVVMFIYFGMILANPRLIEEHIKPRY